MSFELSIKCTKDISELHINFSDGSSSVTTKPVSNGPKKSNDTEQPKEPLEKKRSPGSYKDQILDVDAEFGNVSQDVVALPEIERKDRGVKVADELQNFDF